MSNKTVESIFSPTGKISAKRVVGVLIILVVLGCIIYLVVTEGGTNVVEGLLQTAMLIAAGLLGISSVTSIWKGGWYGAPPRREYKERDRE